MFLYKYYLTLLFIIFILFLDMCLPLVRERFTLFGYH